MGCQGQGGGKVLQVRGGGGAGVMGRKSWVREDVEEEWAEHADVLDVGMRKGVWSKGGPTLGFELGSGVVVGPFLVEKIRLAAETPRFGLDACKIMGGKEVLLGMGFLSCGLKHCLLATWCFLFLPFTWWPVLFLHIPMSTLRLYPHGIWPPPR